MTFMDILSALRRIYDEGDHIVFTDQEGEDFKILARNNAKEILRISGHLLTVLGG